jgi:hypothetical protein
MDTGAGGERPKSAKKVKPRPKSGVSGQTLRPKTGTRREVRRLSTFHAAEYREKKGVATSGGADAAMVIYLCLHIFFFKNVLWPQDAGEGRRRPSLEDEEFKSYEEQYPSARGLVGK